MYSTPGLQSQLNNISGFGRLGSTTNTQVDPLSDFFTLKMDAFGLVDIALVVLLPTWSNRRVGCDNIFKRLDRLLVSADLLDLDLHFL